MKLICATVSSFNVETYLTQPNVWLISEYIKNTLKSPSGNFTTNFPNKSLPLPKTKDKQKPDSLKVLTAGLPEVQLPD